MSTGQKPAPRLLPALMITGAVVLGLKAVAFAEGAPEAEKSAPPPTPDIPAPAPPQPAATPTAGAAPAGQPGACGPTFADAAGLSPSEVQILQSLGARRQSLEERRATLDIQQELVAAAERRIDQRVSELRGLEGRIQALLGKVDEQEAAQMASLVDVYQRMRAKDAALVFDGLDDTVLLDVARRMRQQNLAEIMGKMSPDRARKLTQMLAQRAQIDVGALKKPPA